jgi:hypothetical protein
MIQVRKEEIKVRSNERINTHIRKGRRNERRNIKECFKSDKAAESRGPTCVDNALDREGSSVSWSAWMPVYGRGMGHLFILPGTFHFTPLQKVYPLPLTYVSDTSYYSFHKRRVLV